MTPHRTLAASNAATMTARAMDDTLPAIANNFIERAYHPFPRFRATAAAASDNATKNTPAAAILKAGPLPSQIMEAP